jgi:hypothetical protein
MRFSLPLPFSRSCRFSCALSRLKGKQWDGDDNWLKGNFAEVTRDANNEMQQTDPNALVLLRFFTM